jgi:methyl-accepting chemotaxis protein
VRRDRTEVKIEVNFVMRGTVHSVRMASLTQNARETLQAGGGVGSVSEIATAIASAVEEQSAATTEISGNVHRAAEGTKEVSGNVSEISGASQQTGIAAEDVLTSAGKLSQQAKVLSDEVDRFLESFRAA